MNRWASTDAAERADQNARRWLRAAKRKGIVTVLGGGWWKITGWHKPVQGFGALAVKLAGRGVLDRDGSVVADLAPALHQEGGR
jgi:hypothetical protein